MFRNILAPLDGSPVAELILPYVEQLAGASGLRFTLLRVALPEDYDPDEESYIRFNGGTRISAAEYLKGSDSLIIQAIGSDATVFDLRGGDKAHMAHAMIMEHLLA